MIVAAAAVLVGVLSALAYATYRRDIDRAFARTSTGSQVAQTPCGPIALRYPERCTALVLLVPAAFVPRPAGAGSMKSPTSAEFLVDTVFKSNFLFWVSITLARPWMIESILATPLDVVRRANAEEQARAAQMLEHMLPISPRRSGLANDIAVVSALSRYALENIKAPTLVIGFADDRFGTYDIARYTAEHIPGARFIAYSSGGHVAVGHQTDVTAKIASFLTAAGAGR